MLVFMVGVLGPMRIAIVAINLLRSSVHASLIYYVLVILVLMEIGRINGERGLQRGPKRFNMTGKECSRRRN